MVGVRPSAPLFLVMCWSRTLWMWIKHYTTRGFVPKWVRIKNPVADHHRHLMSILHFWTHPLVKMEASRSQVWQKTTLIPCLLGYFPGCQPHGVCGMPHSWPLELEGFWKSNRRSWSWSIIDLHPLLGALKLFAAEKETHNLKTEQEKLMKSGATATPRRTQCCGFPFWWECNDQLSSCLHSVAASNIKCSCRPAFINMPGATLCQTLQGGAP